MNRFGRIVRAVGGRPLAVLAAVALLAVGAGVLALGLEPSVSTSSFTSGGSDTARATDRFHRQFGDDAVVVLVKGNLQRTVLTADLGRLISLEGCLAGNIPARSMQGLLAEHRRDPSRGLPAVCERLRTLHPARVVFGPGTFINTSANQITDEFKVRQAAAAEQAQRQAAAASRQAKRKGEPPKVQRQLAQQAGGQVKSQFTRQALQLALRYGISGLPTVKDTGFVSQLVFDSTTGKIGKPKSRFSYLFPSNNAALIQVRLRPGLTDSQRRRAIDLIGDATRAPIFVPRQGAHYVVSGVPVVAQGLGTAVQHAIFILLGAALLVMAATLAVVFRTRLRLLPLLLALGASAMTFGALALVGGTLTMASIAVLPVLIGLAVDYAIQFQARYDELRPRSRSPREAAAAAATAGGPTIAAAGLATAAGFLVLLLSPVPMVRGFGVLLVVGVALALACALTAGFAALVRFGDPPADDVPPPFPRVRDRLAALGATRAARATSRAAAGVRELVGHRAQLALAYSLRRPRKVLLTALAVAVLGLGADTQSEVVSDVQRLVPQDLGALRDVNELQKETGVSGEIDVTVSANDITRPDVIAWMSRFQYRVLRAHGYKSGATCKQRKRPPELCPALSLPDLFQSASGSRQQVRGLLDSVPAYFSQGVVSRDRKTANMAFGIRLMALDRQKRVVDDMKKDLDPPKGVHATVVGLPVLAAEANAQLSSPLRRGLGLIAALLAVFLVLLAVRRNPRAAAVPLIPIALATGWSGGVLFVLGLLPGWFPLAADLNPMSAALGALVIAISTEFSVLLSARYALEREAGASPGRAMEITYRSTGAAVLASGATAIAGFAALIVSDITMLHDFGVVTVVDLSVSLLGVMIVLPAALVWAEQHGPFTLRDLDLRPLAREAWTNGRGQIPSGLRARWPRPPVRLPARPRLPSRRTRT